MEAKYNESARVINEFLPISGYLNNPQMLRYVEEAMDMNKNHSKPSIPTGKKNKIIDNNK